MGPTPSTGLAYLCLSGSTLRAFAAALHAVVASEDSMTVPSPAPYAPTGKVATLSLLYLRFACDVAVDGDLPPIWEAVSQGKGMLEGLATLNQALIRGLQSCRQVFGRKYNFSASLDLLAFVNNLSLLNPSLEPACTGGGGGSLSG